jgi:hypothetical protein
MPTNVSPKVGKIVDLPDQTVTIGTATDGGTGTTASVPFTAGSVATGGPVNYFTATSTPGSFTANASASPIIVSGLSAGTAYTFKVKAGNATGYSNAGDSAASNSVTPVLPPSFYNIATVTAAGGETSLTLSSIPSTYKSLHIRAMFKDTYTTIGDFVPSIRFNSDATGGNYETHSLYGQGTGAGATSGSSTAINFYFGGPSSYTGTTNMFGVNIYDIDDYASTTKYKVIRHFGGSNINATGTQYGVSLESGVWLSTGAISSIKFLPAANTFVAGSTIALYGVN